MDKINLEVKDRISRGELKKLIEKLKLLIKSPKFPFLVLSLIVLIFIPIRIYVSNKQDAKNRALYEKAQQLQKEISSSATNPSLKVKQNNSQLMDEKVDWNPNVEEYSPSENIDNLTRSIFLHETQISSVFNYSQVYNQENQHLPSLNPIKYYNVGTWESGPYTGKPIIDAVLTIKNAPSYNGPMDTTYILRETPVKDSLVIYAQANPYGYDTGFLNLATVSSRLTFEEGEIPDVIYSYPLSQKDKNGQTIPVQFPIDYQGTTHNFSVSGYGPPTNQDFDIQVKDGYKYFATFFHGQKLYGKDQGQNIFWKDLDYPSYYMDDVDHTNIVLDYSSHFPEDITKSQISWIKPPALMNDVKGYVDTTLVKPLKDVSEIYYSTTFGYGCSRLSMSDLAGISVLNTNDLELVGKLDNYQLYRPTNADFIMQNMYNDLKIPQNPDIQMSLDQYKQSYPILLLKDPFGEYEAVFRSDRPGLSQCGKPVIYLYPTQKTDVKVSFGSAMRLTNTEPTYNNGWDVTAYPDGKLVNNANGKTYPYLYWEGNTENKFPADNEATVVKKANIRNYLSQTLSDYGLSDNEKSDFISYWLPFLSSKPYYEISFYTTGELDKTIPEYIYPQPQSVLRILMKYQGLQKPIDVQPQPKPAPFVRKGFTVIEWGGIYGN